MKLSLDCQAASRLISDGHEDKLPAADRARLRLHFVMCATCRNVDEQMQFLRRAIRQMDERGSDPTPPGRRGD